MVKSIEGVYREGRVELLEPAPAGEQPTRVIVTFLVEPSRVDLSARGMMPDDAAELRQRLTTFGDDWDRPEMDVYDAL